MNFSFKRWFVLLVCLLMATNVGIAKADEESGIGRSDSDSMSSEIAQVGDDEMLSPSELESLEPSDVSDALRNACIFEAEMKCQVCSFGCEAQEEIEVNLCVAQWNLWLLSRVDYDVCVRKARREGRECREECRSKMKRSIEGCKATY